MAKTLVLAIHGERDGGEWTHTLERHLRDTGADIVFKRYPFSRTDMLSAVLPGCRNSAVENFSINLQILLRDADTERIAVVAHGFGTLLFVDALEHMKRDGRPDLNFETVIFAGSVLPPDRNLNHLVGQSKPIKRLINDCGTTDTVLLFTLLVPHLGMGGRVGLRGKDGPALINRFFDFRHDGYFKEAGGTRNRRSFMQRWWVPLIAEQSAAVGEHPLAACPKTISGSFWRFLGANGGATTFLIYLALLGLMIRGVYANHAGQIDAQRLAALEQAQNLAALTATATDPSDYVTRMLIALNSPDLENTPQVRSTLYSSYLSNREFAILPAHTDRVRDIAISTNGRLIATASADKTVMLWNALDQTQVFSIRHSSPVASTALNADGSLLLTATQDGIVRIWDIASQEQILKLTAHSKAINSVAFSPNGKDVLTASGDGTAKVFILQRGGKDLELAATLYHDGPINVARFSGDGRYVVSASADRTARIWDTGTGKQLHVLKGHSGEITTAAFSPDGRRVVTAGSDQTAIVWDRPDPKADWRASITLTGHRGALSDAMFDGQARRVLTASRDRTVRIWWLAPTPASPTSEAAPVRISQPLLTLAGHADAIGKAIFSPDGLRVLTASDDRTARLWDIREHLDQPRVIAHGVKFRSIIERASFSPGAAQVAMSSADGTTTLVEPGNAKSAVLVNGRNAVYSRDGTRIPTTSGRAGLIWDRNARLLWRLVGHDGPVTTARFNRTGKFAFTTSHDKTVRIWDMRSGSLVRTLVHEAPVRVARFSNDERWLVSGDDAGNITAWNTATGQQAWRHTLQNGGGVSSLAINPGSSKVAAGSSDGRIAQWALASGTKASLLRVHELAVTGISFDASGRKILTTSPDGTGRLLDAATGQTIHWLFGHTDSITASNFSPDQKLIVTASLDGTARLWNAANGKTIAVLDGHCRLRHDLTACRINDAGFSADGRHVITASNDATARIWPVFSDVNELVAKAKSMVPRCLRSQDGLRGNANLVPPEWCLIGTPRSTADEKTRMVPKWPFHTKDWREWLIAKHRGNQLPLPNQPR